MAKEILEKMVLFSDMSGNRVAVKIKDIQLIVTGKRVCNGKDVTMIHLNNGYKLEANATVDWLATRINDMCD